MGLEIGKRSIVTHQVALGVTGHNIANANTVGYSRQAANIVTTRPWHTPVLVDNARVGQLGTGVEVADIQRYRDTFIDAQIRNETRTAGYWGGMQESLARIEGILNEPNDEGLRGIMDKYWQSWQDLSVNPESESSRSVVIERTMGMAESFNHAYRQLVDLRDDVNATIKVKTDEINSIAVQIRDLNKQIQSLIIAGKQPNDLLDKRDLLVDQLSGLVNIQVYDEITVKDKTFASDKESIPNGMIAIQIGGRSLVQGGEVCKLAVEKDFQDMYLVVWEDTRVKTDINGGELMGLLDIRGRTHSSKEENPWDATTSDYTGPSEYKEIIPKMIDDLNTLARTIIERTNDLHRSGYSLSNSSLSNLAFPDGQNFFAVPDPLTFDGNWAQSIAVDDEIKNDIRKIAAASNATWENGAKVNFGDGSKALQIAQLKHDLNRIEYTVKTGDLGNLINPAVLQFPSNTLSGTLSVLYKDPLNPGVIKTTNITLAPPAKPYKDLQSLASAIQAELSKNSDLITDKVTVNVRCDGQKLSFYSNSDNFLMVENPDLPFTALLDGTSFGERTENKALVQDATTDDFWRGICAEIGVQSQEAQRMVKNQDTLLKELENKRQSVAGVSLDEEMTNMIKFQHAYNAASRFITSIDEQIETIVNRMGLVGRS